MIERSHRVVRALGSTVLYGFLLAILLSVSASLACAQATSKSFSVQKFAEKDVYSVGETIKYTVKIKNTGTTRITRPTVSIYDPMAETTPKYTSDTDFPLHQGDVAKAVYYYTVRPTDAGKTLRNTVTVTVRGLSPKTATATVTIRGTVINGGIDIEKTARVLSDDQVKYTITIANTGNIYLRNVSVTDTLLGDLTDEFFPYGCPRVLGVDSDPITRSFIYDVQCDDPNPLENTATVSAYLDGTRKRISDSETVCTRLTPPNDTVGAADIYLYDQGYANPAGKNIWNTTGVGQTQYVQTCAGTTITLPIRVVNTTGRTVTLRIKGSCGDSNWTVTYVNAMNGGTVITNQVTGSGWNPSCCGTTMSAGAARDFIVRVTPRSGLYHGLNTKIYISVIVEGTTKTDTVVADVCVR